MNRIKIASRRLRAIGNSNMELKVKWFVAGLAIFLAYVAVSQVQFSGQSSRQRATDRRASGEAIYQVQVESFITDYGTYQKCTSSADTRKAYREGFTKIFDALITLAEDRAPVIVNDLKNSEQSFLSDPAVQPLDASKCKAPTAPTPPKGVDAVTIVVPAQPVSTDVVVVTTPTTEG